MTLLITIHDIRKALGRDYLHIVKKYDIKARERSATQRAKKNLNPQVCACCGRDINSQFNLDAAHISPLAECSKTTSENLILLCSKKNRENELDCHTLFDQGYCSINEMFKCRKRWVANMPATLIKQILKKRNEYGPHPLQQGNLRGQLNIFRKEQKHSDNECEEWNALQIQIAEVTRRRARKDALKRAWKELDQVNPIYLRNGILISRYMYEKGYIELLSGRLSDAFADFYRGRKALESNMSAPEYRWRWAAHTALLAQLSCILRFKNAKSTWTWNKIRNELNKALEHSRGATNDLKKSLKPDSSKSFRNEYRSASRWVHNCLLFLIKPDIAQGKFSNALERWKIAYRNWLTMDISNGWDNGFRFTQLWLYGAIHLGLSKKPDHVNEALAYLVRSLVLLLGLRRQQPEGVRDLLFAISEALKQNKDLMYKHVKIVAARCFEFSSWFNPYVPLMRKERMP